MPVLDGRSRRLVRIGYGDRSTAHELGAAARPHRAAPSSDASDPTGPPEETSMSTHDTPTRLREDDVDGVVWDTAQEARLASAPARTSTAAATLPAQGSAAV
ncbi:hypothetical protein AEQ27_14835 [Frigoribacterium sp. RIT-PI-h]|nr:hypothetical protein AEQ27_14835 [Frigoribacterium sp. RIT-PI-h]